MDEKKRIERVYARYEADEGRNARYSVFRPEVLAERQALERAALELLARCGFASRMGEARLLDIGAGSGSWGLRVLGWGIAPEHLTINELYAPRLARARENLSARVRFVEGDGAQIGEEHDGAYDIVCMNTVLSSILDEEVRKRLCARVERLLAPGGVALIYDFMYDNPGNRSVRRVTRAQLRSYFAGRTLLFRRLTLAPPLARRLASVPIGGRALLRLLNVPVLRTHLLACVRK